MANKITVNILFFNLNEFNDLLCGLEKNNTGGKTIIKVNLMIFVMLKLY